MRQYFSLLWFVKPCHCIFGPSRIQTCRAENFDCVPLTSIIEDQALRPPDQCG